MRPSGPGAGRRSSRDRVHRFALARANAPRYVGGVIARRCLALAVLILALSATPAAADTPRTITVTGSATLTVPNDLATVSFGVRTARRTTSDALSATSARLRSVIARLGSLGIAPADLATGTIDVQRTTRPLRPGSKAQVVEYVASASVRATIRDVPRTGEITSAAVAAGATSVDGPSFTAADPSETARQALAAAFADARAKAQRLADAAGIDVGDPVSIQEGTPNIEASPQSGVAPSTQGAPTRPRVPPPVRPGRSTVSATVTVVFEIG